MRVKKNRKIILAIFLVLLLALTFRLYKAIPSKAAWYNSSWAYRKELVFNNSASSTNLTDFAVMVKLTSSNFNFSQTQSAGQDIRFTDNDGTTLLSYEIEKFDTSGNEAIIWVKVPQINASSSTDSIYLYWGNGSATDAQSADNTWNTNYKGVYHLNDNAASTTVTDSSGNANTITAAANTNTEFYKSTGNTAGSFLTAGSPTYIADQTATNSSELYPDIALDSSGYPVIAYYDGTNLNLMLVHCNDKECKGNDESVQTVVFANDQGAYPTIQLDGSGYPMIAYHDVTGLDLEYVHCNDANCAGGDETYTTLDSTNSVGQFPRMVKDASGFPVIAYHYLTGLDLRVIHCGNANCSSGNVISNVDTDGNIGSGYKNIDIVLDATGSAVISTYDTTNTEPKIIHCNDANCTTVVKKLPLSTLSLVHGSETAIELDASGNPMLAYYNSSSLQLNYIHCDDSNCDGDESGTKVVLETNYGRYPTMEKSTSGNPVIMATVALQSLGYYACSTTSCSGTTNSTSTLTNIHFPAGTNFKLDANNDYYGVAYVYGKTTIWDSVFFTSHNKLSRVYDADFDFGTSSFSISTWFKSTGKAYYNTLINRYDTDQGFNIYLDHAGHPCFGIDDDATWGPDDSACASDPLLSQNVENLSGWIYEQDMELDSSGYPVIAYYEGSLLNLMLVHCNDVNCAGGDEVATTIDSTGDVGRELSLALDSSDYPVIAYYDVTNGDLKLVHCGNSGCTAGNSTQVIDNTSASVGMAPTVKLDSSGYPVIAYTDTSNGNVKLAHCTDVNCDPAVNGIENINIVVGTTNDSRTARGSESLHLDASGFPMIAYQNVSVLDLEYVHCNDVNCAGSNETFNVLYGTGVNAGNYHSMALDPSGYPVIISITAPTGNGQMTFVHCGSTDCTPAGNTVSTLKTQNDGSANYYLNIEVNSSGYPVILHTQFSGNSNMLIVCNDANCAGDNENYSLLRGSNFNYYYHSLAIDSAGYPVIGLSAGFRDLEVLHMNNTTLHTDSASRDDNSWHHLTAVKNGTSSLTLYLDGVAVATDSAISATGTLTSNSAILALAQTMTGGKSTYNFTGYMDEVQIDTTARSSDWVKAQYLSESNSFINMKFTQYGAIANTLGNFTNNTGAIKNNLVAHYKFDEGYGTTANNSGSGGSSLNGTLSGATWTSDGKINKALIFDGINDYVQLGTSNLDTYFDTLDDWSITSYFKISSWNDQGTVFANRYADTEFIRIQTNGTSGNLIVTTRDSASSIITATLTGLSLETWYHLVVSRDYGGNFVVYLNGKSVYSTADTRTGDFISEAGSHEYFAGKAIYSGDWVTWRYFTGIIDEVKIYSAALTAAEVLQEYNQKSAISLGSLSDTSSLTGGTIASNSASAQYCVPGSSDSCNSPVTEWNFEEGTGTALNDKVGNTTAGTWNGTGNHWVSGKIGKAGGFNGTDDYVDLGTFTKLDGVTSFTVSTWVYKEEDGNFPTYDGILGIGTGAQRTPWVYGNNGATTLSAQFETTTGGVGDCNAVSGALSANAWSHITLVWNGTSCQFYINGSISGAADTTTGGTLASTDGTNYLGRIIGYDYWNGAIDNTRIYNYARTPAQIAWDYNLGHPVSHYKLDDCTGSNLNDSSGNGQTMPITIGATGTQTAVGTCSTSGAWFAGATGKYGSSLNFDGTDDYARKTSYTYDTRDRFTLATWVKSSSMCSASHYLVELEYGKPLLWTGGAGCTTNVTMRNSGDTAWNSYLGSTALTNNTWYHLAATYDTATDSVKIYVNGKLDGTGTHTSQGGTAATVLGIGGRSTVYFPGQLDDVRVYNYALTPSQIKMVYNEGSAVRFGP